MENKIYNFNFWHTRDNYGAILTSYALQSLTPMQSNILVNNSILKKELEYKDCEFSFCFQYKYLTTTQPINNNMEILNQTSKCFIVGSDQVFRPIYCQGKLEQYLLDFVKPEAKKIAFSASFGVDKGQFLQENSVETIEHLKNSLKSFDLISVREKSGIEICKDVLGVDVEWIIDPVFIYNDWGKLINSTPHPSPLPQGARGNVSFYKNKIVSYVLDTGEEYQKVYKHLENKYQKKVMETANSNISVENWLKSIKDCELFITDSFHGMCFALIFNKPFICVANNSRGGTRFESICEMLGIENQCLDSIEEIYQKDCVFKIDYNNANKRIEEERQKGLEFLNNALEAPTGKQKEKQEVRTNYLEKRVCELEQQANLKYQIKKSLWNLWLIIWHKYLPKPIKSLVNVFRRKENA